MRSLRRILVPVVAVCLALAVAAPAAAAWIVTAATGDGAAAGSTVNPPTTPVTAVTGSSVTLSWTAPSTGAIPSGYSVQRTSPLPAPVCTATAATTCTDTGLSPTTTYTYEITSLVGVWVSTPLTATATTSTPLPSAFVVTVPATATAGTPFTVTIQARKSDGTNDTTYNGVHALTFSGPGTIGAYAPIYPANATFNAGGFATISVTLFKAESVTITVADGDPSRTGVSGVVAVAPRVGTTLRWTTDAAGLIPACPSGTLVVGVGGQRTWYVGVLDTYGNRAIQGGAATVTIRATAGNGTPPNGTLTVNAGANPAVTATAFTMKLKKKGGTATTWRSSSPSLTATSCTLSPT